MGTSTWALGLALVGATVLAALLVSDDDGSASAAAAQKIALIRTSTDPGGVRFDLYVINADGSGSHRLVEVARPTIDTGQAELSDLSWSPDGRKIAYVGMGDDGNVDVYVVGADGLGQERLTRHPGVDGNPAWSPDGRQIAFTRRSREWNGVGKTYIHVMNADGSRQRRLTHGQIHFSVAWSPDGKKMLFERRNFRHPRDGPSPGEFPEDLHVMNADGSGQRRLTRDPAEDEAPAWSPDGRQIAFTRDWKNASIWVMNPDGSGQRRLTSARWYSASGAAWSPDGSKIAFGGGPSTSPSGVFVMNADGSERRRLTQRGESPAWSPDGQMIAFDHLVVGTGPELCVMTADGRGKRKLMGGIGGVPSTFDWAWSPRRN